MIVSVSEGSDYAASIGLSADEVEDVSNIYTASQIYAVKKYFVVAMIDVLMLIIFRTRIR